MSADAKVPAARIYDVRYARFSGSLQPRWRSILALARSSAGRALGLRRSAGAKVWPFLLIAFAYLPAVIVVGIPVIAHTDESALELMSYVEMLGVITLVLVAFTATTIPSLLTRERRDRVLSLYFSTALSPTEYVVGKVLAGLGLLLLVTLGPLLVLLFGSILTAAAPLAALRHQAGDIPRILAAGLIIAAFHAALALALGSLTSKRVFAVGGYLAIMLVTGGMSAVLYEIRKAHAVLALDLASIPIDVVAAIFPRGSADDAPRPPTALAWGVDIGVLLLSGLALALRYRKGQDR